MSMLVRRSSVLLGALSVLVAGLGLLSLSATAGPGPQKVDSVSALLEQGPLIRVDVDKGGRFQKSTVLIEVDAPLDHVWATLADFEAYPRYMPRCEEVKVERKGDHVLVHFELDTPLVSTSYTSRYRLLEARRRAEIRIIDGDLEGSTFTWQLDAVGADKTRITYDGIVKNFSSIAEQLDDDQQSITIGINVVSLLQSAKALKREAEQRLRARPAAP